MAEITVKCTSVSKGTVRFAAVSDQKDAKELNASGMPHYGQADFVLPEEEANEFKAGSFYTMSIDEVEYEGEGNTGTSSQSQIMTPTSVEAGLVK